MDNPYTESSDIESAGITWHNDVIDWLGRHDRTVVLSAIGFQLVVLVWMMATPLMTLTTGDTILLRVAPVDPRDLFRGDYVILSYEFSRVPNDGITGLSAADQQGQTVYTSIEPEDDGKHWRATQFSIQQPSVGKFLKGQITRRNRIEYGIESFFVQEGEGTQYEEAVRSRSLSAEVALDDNGNAVLKRLVIN